MSRTDWYNEPNCLYMKYDFVWGKVQHFLLNSDAMIHTISQFCPEGSRHWSPHLFKSKRNSCWDRARSTSIISLKIFLVVLIVDSFSEALLSTSPVRTVPANVQITATQLFFHYRLCKTNYYYHYYYFYYYYHCYYFHYYYYYSIIESAKLICPPPRPEAKKNHLRSKWIFI